MPYLHELRAPDSHLGEIRRQPFGFGVSFSKKKKKKEKIIVHIFRVISARLGPIQLGACEILGMMKKMDFVVNHRFFWYLSFVLL